MIDTRQLDGTEEVAPSLGALHARLQSGGLPGGDAETNPLWFPREGAEDRKTIGKPWENGGLMGFYGGFMVIFHGIL